MSYDDFRFAQDPFCFQKGTRTPKLRHHKATGQGFIEVKGHRTYLGKFDAPETKEKYHRWVAEWLSASKTIPAPVEELTVNELVARFWTYAESYYRRADGTVTDEINNYRQAFKPLVPLYGSSKVSDFGPLRLKAVRDRMIELGWCRTNINKMVSRVRRLFRWGVENELVEPSIAHGLAAVAGLRYGRSGARESEPVKPVPAHVVDETLKHATPTLTAMIRLQQLTGMRPGELVQLRVCDLDLSGDVWQYRPEQHKTQHHGKTRVVLIGPRGQDVLRPYLTTDPNAYVFSPAKSEQERRDALTKARKTPLSCGNRPGTNVKRRPKRTPSNRYCTTSYGRAICHACDAAWPPPDGTTGDDLKQWRREHRWSPNRLRHSFATDVRKTDGLEAAEVLCGHSNANITQVYAERDLNKAVEVIRRIG